MGQKGEGGGGEGESLTPLRRKPGYYIDGTIRTAATRSRLSGGERLKGRHTHGDTKSSFLRGFSGEEGDLVTEKQMMTSSFLA